MRLASWKVHVIPLAAALLFIGCANTRQALVSSNMAGGVKNPRGLRIAILPFKVSPGIDQEKGAYLRRQVYINFKRGGYNLVEKFVVDGVLATNDWDRSNLKEVPPQTLGEALGADAIIYGKLTNWEKSYLAIHSSITIGCKIKLVDARSGEVLWKADYKKTDYDGLLKLPTGISSVVLAPILFLARTKNQFRLADKVTREMLAFLVQPEKFRSPRLFEKPVLMTSPEKALAEIREESAPDSRYASLFEKETDGSKPLAESSGQDRLPEPGAKTSSKTEKRYTIQVGSYTRRAGARNLTKRLQGKGIDAFISRAELRGKTWYRVQVRNFGSIREARRFALETMDGAELPYFIAPVPVKAIPPAG